MPARWRCRSAAGPLQSDRLPRRPVRITQEDTRHVAQFTNRPLRSDRYVFYCAIDLTGGGRPRAGVGGRRPDAARQVATSPPLAPSGRSPLARLRQSRPRRRITRTGGLGLAPSRNRGAVGAREMGEVYRAKDTTRDSRRGEDGSPRRVMQTGRIPSSAWCRQRYSAAARGVPFTSGRS